MFETDKYRFLNFLSIKMFLFFILLIERIVCASGGFGLADLNTRIYEIEDQNPQIRVIVDYTASNESLSRARFVKKGELFNCGNLYFFPSSEEAPDFVYNLLVAIQNSQHEKVFIELCTVSERRAAQIESDLSITWLSSNEIYINSSHGLKEIFQILWPNVTFEDDIPNFQFPYTTDHGVKEFVRNMKTLAGLKSQDRLESPDLMRLIETGDQMDALCGCLAQISPSSQTRFLSLLSLQNCIFSKNGALFLQKMLYFTWFRSYFEYKILDNFTLIMSNPFSRFIIFEHTKLLFEMRNGVFVLNSQSDRKMRDELKHKFKKYLFVFVQSKISLRILIKFIHNGQICLISFFHIVKNC